MMTGIFRDALIVTDFSFVVIQIGIFKCNWLAAVDHCCLAVSSGNQTFHNEA